MNVQCARVGVERERGVATPLDDRFQSQLAVTQDAKEQYPARLVADGEAVALGANLKSRVPSRRVHERAVPRRLLSFQRAHLIHIHALVRHRVLAHVGVSVHECLRHAQRRRRKLSNHRESTAERRLALPRVVARRRRRRDRRPSHRDQRRRPIVRSRRARARRHRRQPRERPPPRRASRPRVPSHAPLDARRVLPARANDARDVHARLHASSRRDVARVVADDDPRRRRGAARDGDVARERRLARIRPAQRARVATRAVIQRAVAIRDALDVDVGAVERGGHRGLAVRVVVARDP